ncbi:unnamed protein product [Calypogeia fissa]
MVRWHRLVDESWKAWGITSILVNVARMVQTFNTCPHCEHGGVVRSSLMLLRRSSMCLVKQGMIASQKLQC